MGARNNRNNKILTICLTLFCFISLSCSLTSPFTLAPNINSDTPIPIQQIIDMTHSAGAAQTAAVFSSTPLPTATLAPTTTPPSTTTSQLIAGCDPGDQIPYVYHPERLIVLANCIHVTGLIVDIRHEADGDLHILVNLDTPYVHYLTAANADELGALVVEPVCVNTPTQEDAIEPCSHDPNPLSIFPSIGQQVWMEGQYVTDSEHGGWAEIHPLARWGLFNGQEVAQPTKIIPVNTLVIVPIASPAKNPTAISSGNSGRIGATCNDGTSSGATGRGACSHHGGVRCWRYSDGSCTP